MLDNYFARFIIVWDVTKYTTMACNDFEKSNFTQNTTTRIKDYAGCSMLRQQQVDTGFLLHQFYYNQAELENITDESTRIPTKVLLQYFRVKQTDQN
jgi:hypothetical protein